ncbi:uncharacterized protein AB675_8124 [Cyphellophora attinorum]|uniref:RING-type domain-containing protein n=1 Tax=Cyphellophora attinorum TaxID=1664694 RepID=A0A0N0NNB8_9EURO|nr:uncharacterized protein AB675_8124 [Phialophora attinorum]KPI41189.1 hypothetical protein AB675_8124 [Phialophora attinorum]
MSSINHNHNFPVTAASETMVRGDQNSYGHDYVQSMARWRRLASPTATSHLPRSPISPPSPPLVAAESPQSPIWPPSPPLMTAGPPQSPIWPPSSPPMTAEPSQSPFWSLSRPPMTAANARRQRIIREDLADDSDSDAESFILPPAIRESLVEDSDVAVEIAQTRESLVEDSDSDAESFMLPPQDHLPTTAPDVEAWLLQDIAEQELPSTGMTQTPRRHGTNPTDPNPGTPVIDDRFITHQWTTSSQHANPSELITIHNGPFPETHIPLLRPEAIEQDKCCGICIEDYKTGDVMAIIPCNGMHRFHLQCIQPWLTQRAQMTCPFCRTELKFGKVLQAAT